MIQSSYKVFKKLSDIEKALDYLNGSVSNEEELQESLRAAEKENQTNKIPLRYFTVTFYKKGTCHIEFTNLELLKEAEHFRFSKGRDGYHLLTEKNPMNQCLGKNGK